MWTQERKGALSRELLFDPLGSTERRALSVTRLLQLHMGMFMFLCEVRSQSVKHSCSPLPPHWIYFSGLLEQDFDLSVSVSSFHRNVLTVSLASSANAAKKT